MGSTRRIALTDLLLGIATAQERLLQLRGTADSEPEEARNRLLFVAIDACFGALILLGQSRLSGAIASARSSMEHAALGEWISVDPRNFERMELQESRSQQKRGAGLIDVRDDLLQRSRDSQWANRKLKPRLTFSLYGKELYGAEVVQVWQHVSSFAHGGMSTVSSMSSRAGLASLEKLIESTVEFSLARVNAVLDDEVIVRKT